MSALVRAATAAAEAAAAQAIAAAAAFGTQTVVPLSRTVDAMRDSTDAFISGVRADGSRAKWNNPNARRVHCRKVGSYMQVFIADSIGETQLTFTGNNSAPEITLDKILFTSDRRGSPEPYFMNLDGSGQTNAALQLYEHWQFTGQSLSTGDQAGTALTTANADARASMLSLSVSGYGPRSMLDSVPVSDDANIDITKVTGLTPLLEVVKGTRGETPASGFASQYLKDQPASAKVVMDVHGRGAATYSNQGGVYVGPASTHFTNGIVFQQLVKKYVEAAGGAYRYAGTLNVHGESDGFNARSRANYLADIQAWIAAYNQQCRHGSAVHRKQPMFVSQLGTNLRFGGGTLQSGLDIALAQLDAHKLKVGVWLVGPRYMIPSSDGTHATGAGYRWLGEYIGKVARRVKVEGVAWEPVYPKSWTRAGAVINVVFNVPVAPLVFDATVVSDPGQGGFSYIDDTASGITVTAVAVAADGVSVNVTLSGTGFGTNPRFRIAGTQPTTSGGPTAGARATLRDSDTELGVLSGLSLYNYACHFEGAIV